MPRKITLPLTPDGNDPCDYNAEVLASLNAEIDQAHAHTYIGIEDARAYVALYQSLKARCAVRGQDEIGGTTQAYFEKCCAVLRKAGLL